MNKTNTRFLFNRPIFPELPQVRLLQVRPVHKSKHLGIVVSELLQAGCPSCHPTNSINDQSTEGDNKWNVLSSVFIFLFIGFVFVSLNLEYSTYIGKRESRSFWEEPGTLVPVFSFLWLYNLRTILTFSCVRTLLTTVAMAFACLLWH